MAENPKAECTFTVKRPFGCMELWAGNERAHRSLELAGLQGDVIALPSGAERGGDLAAVFSCTDDVARVVLADCVGHGYEAAAVARHVHHLLHKFRDVRDTAGLLEALNDEFTLASEGSDGPLRLTTVVTGTFDGKTGVFTFAYAAHPRMFLWREEQQELCEIGAGLENFPLGFITGEKYLEQTVRLAPGDAILAFSDGATEVESPEGEQLTSAGLSALTRVVAEKLPQPLVLGEFSKALLAAIREYHGSERELADDITLLTMRRVAP
jgi:sigma-B regulation protein RsbU (phosphoserine phosphatase)